MTLNFVRKFQLCKSERLFFGTECYFSLAVVCMRDNVEQVVLATRGSALPRQQHDRCLDRLLRGEASSKLEPINCERSCKLHVNATRRCDLTLTATLAIRVTQHDATQRRTCRVRPASSHSHQMTRPLHSTLAPSAMQSLEFQLCFLKKIRQFLLLWEIF